jgi:hypothetical protein
LLSLCLTPEQHVVDGPSKLGRQDAQGFPFTVFLFKFCKVLLADDIPSQEQRGRFRESPLEVDVTHLAAGRPLRLTVRLVNPLHQSSVRDEVLDPREASDVVDLVEQGQGEDLANPWNRSQKEEAGVVVLSDLVDEEELQLMDDFVVSFQEVE